MNATVPDRRDDDSYWRCHGYGNYAARDRRCRRPCRATVRNCDWELRSQQPSAFSRYRRDRCPKCLLVALFVTLTRYPEHWLLTKLTETIHLSAMDHAIRDYGV